MPTSRALPSASLKWRAKSSRSRPTDPARNSPSAWLKALSPNLAHIRTLLPPAHRNIGSTLKSLEGRARLRVTKFGDTANDRFLFRVLNAHVRFGPTAANQPKPSDVSYEPTAEVLNPCCARSQRENRCACSVYAAAWRQRYLPFSHGAARILAARIKSRTKPPFALIVPMAACCSSPKER